MKNLSLILLLLLVSKSFVSQVDWCDEINRQEIRRVQLKNCKAKSEIIKTIFYFCSINEESPNSAAKISEYNEQGCKIKTTYLHTSGLSIEYWEYRTPIIYSKTIKYKDGDSLIYEYSFNEDHKCTRFVQLYEGGSATVQEANYDEFGNVSSYVKISTLGLQTKLSRIDSFVVDLKYDSLNRLIESKEFSTRDDKKEFCYNHKTYHYSGDSTIIFKRVGQDLKVSEQEIIRYNTMGKLIMYQKIQFKNYYPLTKKRQKIAKEEREVFDQFGNLIEWKWTNSYHKKENEHEYYFNTLDDNGNILHTEIKNQKGKVFRIVEIVNEYKK